MAKASRYPGVYSYETPTKGKLWACRWEEPIVDGVRKQGHKRGFRTQDAALDYQRRQSLRSARGARELVTSTMPLGDYLEAWLSGMVDVSPNTMRNYRNRLAPIVVQIGNIPINQLTVETIDDAYTAMRRHGQSAAAVRYGNRILKSALKRAVVLDKIAANPCDRITPPRVDAHQPKTWTRDEMQQFLASEIDHPVWGDFWAVLCETWMRVGEITDLRWGDIDSKKNQITVSHAVRRNAALVYESGPVKTSNGRRTIPVHRSLIERLLVRKIRMGNPSAKTLVFPSAKQGKWIEPHVARKALTVACNRADVPEIGLHEVRHSGGSIAYLAGVDLKTISTRLGHADAAFTLKTYAHLNDAHYTATADVIWGLISPGRVKTCQDSDGQSGKNRATTGENRTA